MKKLWEYLYFKQPFILSGIIATIFLFSLLKCGPNSQPASEVNTQSIPGIVAKDSTLPNGDHIVTFRFEGEFVVNLKRADTIVVPPIVPPVNSGFAIGCNTFPYTPVKLYKDLNMKVVRVYAPWHWFCSPSPQGVSLYSQPMKQAWTPECSGIKDYLTQCKSAGIRALFCFNQCPEWLRPTGNGTGGNDYPPIPTGRDRLNPDSYKEYSEFIFQIVATYGKTKHPDSEMRVDQTQQYPNQPVNQIESGLGLMEEIEIGNEWDHWFDGFQSEKYMTAEEQAAMLSKCYDAAKKADPNIRVVMGGITDFNPWYLQRMNAWFIANRPDKKFAADVINVHHYSNFKNKPGTIKPDWQQDGACYPEEDGNFATINEVVALARSWGKDVYVTEFGADTEKPSQMYAAPRNGMNAEQVQAEIIVRTFKAYKAAGVKSAYVFTGPDGSSGTNTGQFSRSGIFTAKPEYRKKAAYEKIKELIKQ